MEEVQRYAAGKERPVLWSVYNEMHLRAANAESDLERLRTEVETARTVEQSDTARLTHLEGENARLRAERDEVARQRNQIALHAMKAILSPVDRAAVLREAADVAACWVSDCQNCAVEMEVASELRRRSDEAQQAETAQRVLTDDEYTRAWHAIEGEAGRDGSDPGTILNTVLAALHIEVEGGTAQQEADHA